MSWLHYTTFGKEWQEKMHLSRRLVSHSFFKLFNIELEEAVIPENNEDNSEVSENTPVEIKLSCNSADSSTPENWEINWEIKWEN